MLQIVSSPSGSLQYRSAHVYHTIEDRSLVPAPTISSNTGTLYTPIYTDKGPTGKVMHFSGMTAYADLISTFGNPNTRRLGLPYTAAVLHAQSGGDVVVQSVKHESATYAGFIVSLCIESKNEDGSNIEKTLGWILPDGTGFVEDAYAGTTSALIKQPTASHVPHKVYTQRISFVNSEVKNMKTFDALELYVTSLFQQEIGNKNPGIKRVFPLIYGLYNGKGSYGNNYNLYLTYNKTTVSGLPTFLTTVYDKKLQEKVKLTSQVVSLSNVFQDGSPLYIERRFKRPYSTGDFTIKTLNQTEMNNLGTVLHDLIGKVNLFPNGATQAGVTAQALEANMENLKSAYRVPEDDDFHAMRNFNPTNVTEFNKIFDAQPAYEFTFTGGTEGLMKNMKEFNWDYQVNVAPATEPEDKRFLLQDMFVKAFTGSDDVQLFSLIANPADYAIDLGYPGAVKNSMITLATQRDDMQLLFNAPINIKEVNEAVNWKQKFNFQGRNLTYFSGNFEYIDPTSQRSFRVPMTFPVMFNVLAHYVNGFYESLAGLDNGLIGIVEPGSDYGLGDKSLKSNDVLTDAGFNPCSVFKQGVLYVDNQKSNYALTEISSLQEFHNNSIINRILKKLYISLQSEKHRLTSKEAVDKINRKVSIDLQEFRAKVQSIDYQGLFNTDYDLAIGLLTHRLSIQFLNTIKYHHIHLIALPQSL